MKYSSAAILALATAFLSSAEAQQTSIAPVQASAQARLALARPDLVFTTRFLRAVPGGPPVQQIRRGQRYWACFIVRNIGAGPSGHFRVAGGGLGIPYNPYQDHAGLAAGASRAGCLTYPTTPAPGFYNLGLMVDSLNAVSESNETNNTTRIPVRIIP